MHLITTLGQALEVAADQHQLLATSDITALGLDRKQVAALCRDGVLERVIRGLYRIPGTRSPLQDIAAAVRRSSGSVASHVSALWLHGIDVRPPVVPQITLPADSTSHSTLGELHRSPLEPADRARRRGIAVTSLARALVDASADLSEPQLHRAIAEALAGRRTTARHVDEVARRLEHEPGRIGHGRLRSVLAGWTDPIVPDSVAEATVLRRIAGFGIPRPVGQHPICDVDGDFIARVDLAWPGHRVAREYDSDAYHPPPVAEADERRRARIEAAGWSIDVIHRGHLLPSREDWLHQLQAEIGRERRAG